MQDIIDWYELVEKLKVLKAQELEMRVKLFSTYFPEPEEGTNFCDIQGGELVADLPYSYTLDRDTMEEALESIPTTKRDKLIGWKPSLVTSVYNKLSVGARKKFTAACLTVTPGTPSLKIVATPPRAVIPATPGE